MFAEDISEDFSDLTFTGFYSVSGYLRNLRARSLSSEKFSAVLALWVFTLKPFPENDLNSDERGIYTNPSSPLWPKFFPLLIVPLREGAVEGQ